MVIIWVFLTPCQQVVRIGASCQSWRVVADLGGAQRDSVCETEASPNPPTSALHLPVPQSACLCKL